MIVLAHIKFGLVQIKGSGVKRVGDSARRPERVFEIPAWIGLRHILQVKAVRYILSCYHGNKIREGTSQDLAPKKSEESEICKDIELKFGMETNFGPLSLKTNTRNSYHYPNATPCFVYKLDCVVHEFIVGKLVFKAINALYIRRKTPYKAIFISFIHTCQKIKGDESKNVKQYLISCPTLVLRYISLNILSEKTFTVRNCFSPHV